ncbi:MAG: M14 family metallopeptidase [Planctomycetota bacterium]
MTRTQCVALLFVSILAGSCTTSAEPARAPARATESARPPRPLPPRPSAASGNEAAFFPETAYDPAIPTPDAHLRRALGSSIVHHADIVAYLRALASKSARIRVVPFGETHERRELVWAAIGTPDNIQKLENIRAELGALADPRALSASDEERIVRDAPAVAWLGYSIHGDETSGSDAAMAVAHHFVAGTSSDVTDVLANVVIVIDPCMNPDGRERILALVEQSAGRVPNLDADSMGKGRWPWGRGNHYLFDMNRDWVFGTQPETRARWAAIRSFSPQLLVDAHEMSAYDTFLFYPANDPFTPHFPAATRKWWSHYGADQAAAFDRYGWSYYTREWADSWAPIFTDCWASFLGATGILYEQARYIGQTTRLPTGRLATYREAVHRQAVSSVANVTTLARNKAEVLRDYVAAKRANLAADAPGNDRMFVLVRGDDPARDDAFVRMLLEQGVEIVRTDDELTARNVESVRRAREDERRFAKGALVISTRQPLSALVKAWLTFDPRYDTDSLNRERKELERKGRSKTYDVTTWSPAHALDVDAYWCDFADVRGERITAVPPREAGLIPLASADTPVYGWVVDGAQDGAVAFAAQALELGLQVQLCEEPFTTAERKLSRWSLLVRRTENEDGAEARVHDAAVTASVLAFATSTARSPDAGPDLGGGHFRLLARPRIALLSNTPVGTDSFGHAWHWIDFVLGLPCTILDAQSFGSYDLRRYNVLVLPEAWGDIGAILKANADALRTWVRGGGTLVASGSSAAALCDKDLDLTSVKLRQDALDDLAKYALSVKREREAGTKKVDEAALWNDAVVASSPTTSETKSTSSSGDDDAKKDAKKSADEEDPKRRDRYLRTFSPHGVILRGEVNADHWLSAGCGDELPVLIDGGNVFLSERPVRTVVRLAAAERLRLSGLLWPEARERFADSAYATVESSGAGQVILFATPPEFRGWFQGSARLFSNAIVYGPGAGASQPVEW